MHPRPSRHRSRSRRLHSLTFATLATCVLGALPLRAATAPAHPSGQTLNDRRLGPLKDLNGYFPFTPPKSTADWAKRAERVRTQILVATGLWPMPEKTPLNPVIHGRIEFDDYTVEKVFFESVPGFFVTGNLYRPKGKPGKYPAVLSPHGHWPEGRFFDNKRIREELVQGAERFAEGGRSMLQSRGVQLARMGCVVFHYDMIGYADAAQIPFEIAHREFEHKVTPRPEMNTTENWGLWTAQAETHLQNVMGLQTWNSIRALDFVLGLPDVDPERIGVTGESGGGTQTFMLCAIDHRPSVAFPAVMVSTGMQGGCTCENTALLRVNTGNVEIAALYAPKPLGMTAADDWTKEMPTKGFPELRQLYRTLGAPDMVALKPLTHFRHNYNYVSRGVMYGWFNKHLKLGLPEPIVEEDHKHLTAAEMTVWTDRYPKPASGPEFERTLLRRLADNASSKIRAERVSLERYRKLVAPAVDVLIGRNLAEAGTVEFDQKDKADRGTYAEATGLLRNKTYGEELPVTLLQPKTPSGKTVLWLDAAGKSALYAAPANSAPRRLKPEIQQLVDAGATVVGVDLLYQGEFLTGKTLEQARLVNDSPIAAYTFGYNHALFAQRVHDILSVIKFIQESPSRGKNLTLVGLDGAGAWAAAARAQAGDAIDRAAIATNGFRFGQLRDIRDVNFLPGGAKYDDLPGMLALSAPRKLWLAGEGKSPDVVSALYQVAGAAHQLTPFSGSAGEIRGAAVKWVLAD